MRAVTSICLVLIATATAFGQSGWNWQNPLPTGSTLEGVIALDMNTYIAVGNGGTVYRTTNAGATWKEQPTPTAAILHARHCALQTRCQLEYVL